LRISFSPQLVALPCPGGGTMTKGSDREYYLARISAEREAAERATSEDVRRVHLKLAEEYQEILDGRREQPAHPHIED